MWLTILVLVIVFCIAWYIVKIIPLPEPVAPLRWIGYVVLCIIAIIVLLRVTGVSLGI